MMMVIILCYLQLLVNLIHNKEFLSLNNAFCIIFFLSLGYLQGVIVRNVHFTGAFSSDLL